MTIASLANPCDSEVDECLYPAKQGGTIGRFFIDTANVVSLKPNLGISFYNVALVETLCTFMFVLVILLCKTKSLHLTPSGFSACLTIGVTLLGMICNCVNISGACLNPAVGFWTVMFSQFVTEDNTNTAELVVVYTLSPVIGGIVAGAFQWIHIYSTHHCEHPDPENYPYMLDGHAMNPPRLAGDSEAFKAIVAKCHEEKANAHEEYLL